VAGAVLEEYAKYTGNLHEPLPDVLRYLVADLRHLCDAVGESGLDGTSFDDLAQLSYRD